MPPSGLINYFVARTTGAGVGVVGISWKRGSGRNPGGLTSLVQQHEVATSAIAETMDADRMRIMGWDTVGLVKISEMRTAGSTTQMYPGARGVPGQGGHFDGVTYVGLDWTVAAFGQHDTENNAVAAAIKASFIIRNKWVGR